MVSHNQQTNRVDRIEAWPLHASLPTHKPDNHLNRLTELLPLTSDNIVYLDEYI